MNEQRYVPRRDISNVRPQGGYMAKRCPLRVYYDAFPPPGTVPFEAQKIDQLRMRAGVEFEAAVFDVIRSQHRGVVDLSVFDDAEAATVRAMQEGVEVILAGTLPLDAVGRRVGKPDILVRAEHRPYGTWAYHPIDVKHHQTLEPMRKRGTPATVGSLAALAFGDARPAEGYQSRWGDSVKDDLLQLAHYHRMLGACGHGSDAAVAAVIGSDQVVVWHRLDTTVFKPRWEGMPRESALQRYDFEFSFRLDVLAAGSTGERIVEPVKTSDCDGCNWETLCVPQMKAADCVSLLPMQGYTAWRAFRRAGLTTRAQVATLDPLAANRVAGITSLPEVIDQALVATRGGGKPHRRRGIEAIEVPNFDVELDIDMENAIGGGVYLWGAFDGTNSSTFVRWDDPASEVEAKVFAEFWEWLTRRRREAEIAGLTLGAFCWNETAEKTALRRGASAAVTHLGMIDAPGEVEQFFDAGGLVDLMKTFKGQLITGGSVSLKAIAPLTGFSWGDEEAGGDNSMAWHHDALHDPDAATRTLLRERLIQYNRNDVLATAVVRTWLRDTAFPSIVELGGMT